MANEICKHIFLNKTGMVFKKLTAFKVKYSNHTKVEFKIGKGLDDALVQIKGALHKKEWTYKYNLENKNSFGFLKMIDI